MGLFVVSFVISLGLLAAFCLLAKSRFGATGVCWLAAAFIIPFGLCMFTGLALQSLLTLAVTLLCLQFRAKARLIVWAPVLGMLLSYGIILSMEARGLRRLSRLRREYPLESISGRLAYEAAATKPGKAESASEAVNLSPDVEERLTASEDRTEHYSRWSTRRGMLSLLHSRASTDFEIAQGFGPARMPHVRAERIELPPVGPIPLPQTADPSHDFEHDSAAPIADQAVAVEAAPTQSELRWMHASGLADFLEPERIGYVQDREHVAGFQSHQFTKLPEFAAPEAQQPASWKIARLELVSLLKHDVPMAYVSTNLPKMNELSNSPTRSLNAFEQRSIDRLRSDEDVMIDETPDRIQMVGSLRAGKNCLACHSVRRGELLGALTYELVPVRPTRKKGQQVSTPSL